MDCIETLYLLFLMSYLTTESPTLFSQLSLAPHDTKIDLQDFQVTKPRGQEESVHPELKQKHLCLQSHILT